MTQSSDKIVVQETKGCPFLTFWLITQFEKENCPSRFFFFLPKKKKKKIHYWHIGNNLGITKI